MSDPNPDADDLYARLGVSPDAPLEEIERSASIAKARFHPGRSPEDDSTAEEQWYRIREAINGLTDEDERAAYDERRSSADEEDTSDEEEPPTPDFETPMPAAEDLYGRIGVAPDAPRVEVMKAAAEAKATFSPSRMAEVDDADVENWERVSEAIDVLTDASQREAYDERRDATR